MDQTKNARPSTSDHDFVRRPRRSKMDVIDFIHGGYVCDGTAWMDVRLRCPKCGMETGWRRDKRTPTYCDHQ